MVNLADLAPLTKSEPGAHTYGRKLRRAMIPMSSIEMLMQMNGEHSYRMEGWPEGAKIVGVDVIKQPFCLIAYLYHADFPVVPHGELPSLIKVTARATS